MRISIAMATYNGARFVDAQLDSLAAQTLPPDELVVCDDGSTDATADLIVAFSRRAPFPVRFLRNPARLGYADNFLHCAALCSGELIAFCDQDDVWHPNKLERLAAEARRRPSAVLIVHQGRVCDTDLHPTGRLYPRVADAQLQRKACGPLWLDVPGYAMLFSRRLIESVPWRQRPGDPNRPDTPLAHDQWIYCIADMLGDIAFLPEDLVDYRRHDANTIRIDEGGRRRRGLREKLSALRDEYRATAALLARYEECFARLAAQCDEAVRGDVAAAAARYGRYGELFRRRAQLYDRATPVGRRLRDLLALRRDGGYRASGPAGGLGGRALNKDCRYVLLAGL
jgi:glycosyltransferase involved in cell wall biosynthesis